MHLSTFIINCVSRYLPHYCRLYDIKILTGGLLFGWPFVLEPWQGGKPRIWDVAFASTLATSYTLTDTAATGAGLIAYRPDSKQELRGIQKGLGYF